MAGLRPVHSPNLEESALPQSVDEKRGYTRGYNRAVSRCQSRVSRALEIARGYREKAEAAIYHDTVPRCLSCARWTRGGENCLWGYCRADFQYAAGEQGMWADRFVGEANRERPIVTQEMFGCVNWIGRAAVMDGHTK